MGDNYAPSLNTIYDLDEKSAYLEGGAYPCVSVYGTDPAGAPSGVVDRQNARTNDKYGLPSSNLP